MKGRRVMTTIEGCRWIGKRKKKTTTRPTRQTNADLFFLFFIVKN